MVQTYRAVLINSELDIPHGERVHLILKAEERSVHFQLMFRCSRNASLEVTDTQSSMPIRNGVNGPKRVGRIKENDFGSHPVLNALIDVHAEGRGFVVLDDPFFNTNRSIPMLLYPF